MKRMIIVILIHSSALLSSCETLEAIFGSGSDEKYVIRRQSTSNVCQVWISTASPVGDRIGGEYNSREEAQAAMCEFLRNGTCQEVNPSGACR
ncbi:hypothetical protein [Niastella vici]|uniref:hypothetical protein n=1 Tax=Niastella vici TaxID=1703345 RepID=UPI00117E242B|nr:hypothetical protein [Niastella vici]